MNNRLGFDTYVTNICKRVSKKFLALARISIYWTPWESLLDNCTQQKYQFVSYWIIKVSNELSPPFINGIFVENAHDCT